MGPISKFRCDAELEELSVYYVLTLNKL